ncbi:MAG TPA: APC family permease, partial [Methanomicrobiales archaeon]|nr:APC family permease [Methanomicrobiales archaeon]
MSHGGGSFKKELSVYSLLAMSLGTVIGSGWLLLPGIVASQAGPAAVISWILGGCGVLIVALVYSELGATWPAAGAVAKYPGLSHGRFTGHMAGWAAFIAYAVTPPAEAVAVVKYAAVKYPSLVNPKTQGLTLLGIAIAILILAVIGLLNYVGVKYLGIFENYVTALKYIPIAVFVVFIGFLAFHSSNFTAFGGFVPHGPSGILLGTSSTVFAYIGLRQALDFGSEAKNPGKDIPRALIGTVVIAMITYILISIVMVGGLNWSALASNNPHVVKGQWSSLSHLDAPMYAVAGATGLGLVAALILADGIISPNGPNASNVGSVPRVAYTMAEDGTMPKLFQRLHPKYGTPGAGLLVCFVLEIFFLFITSAGYNNLISVINVAVMVAYALGPVSMGALRKTAPHVDRPYRISGARFLAPLAFVIASLLLYWEKWPLTGEMLGILLFGALIYAAYAYWGNVSLSSVMNGLWLIGYLISMAVISYLGSSKFGGRNIIPFGWDILVI